MKHIIKKLALLFVPVYLWFAFFVAFEPNNYFGIKKTTSSSQPVACIVAKVMFDGKDCRTQYAV